MVYYQVLEKETKKILPLFKNLKKNFYLAGGTGLALQLNHRKSYDLDFFSEKHFDSKKVFFEMKTKNNTKFKIIKKIEDQDALFLEINNVSVNFLYSKYKLIKKPIVTKYLKIAHIIDIACLKLAVLTERIEFKDYVDLYFVFKKIPLKKVIKFFELKIFDIDPVFALKCLVSFEEVKEEKLDFIKKTNLNEIKKFFLKEVKKLIVL